VEVGDDAGTDSADVVTRAASGVGVPGSSGATSFTSASVEVPRTATADTTRYRRPLPHRCLRGVPTLISIDPAWIDVPLTSPSTSFSVD
jgi:hypothetical protein